MQFKHHSALQKELDKKILRNRERKLVGGSLLLSLSVSKAVCIRILRNLMQH